jgi:hypothetical protein
MDASRMYSGYPYLSAYGPNSDVLVYDTTTRKLLRKESPNGQIIEVY